MDFEPSRRTRDLIEKLEAFMAEQVYPVEGALMEGSVRQPAWTSRESWKELDLIEELKAKARKAGLWNLFLPDPAHGPGLSNHEYAPLCEIMGRSPFAPEIFNCSAPDTGNMEVLARYGTEEQK